MKTLYEAVFPIEPKTTTHQSREIVYRFLRACPKCKSKFLKARTGACPKCGCPFPVSLADSKSLAMVKAHYEGAVNAAPKPDAPISVPVVLQLYFGFPNPAGTPKRSRNGIRWKMIKPDTSNLAKTFEDVLVRCGILADDNLVVVIQAVKYYTEAPQIGVIISRAPGLNPGLPIADQVTVATLYDSGEDMDTESGVLFGEN